MKYSYIAVIRNYKKHIGNLYSYFPDLPDMSSVVCGSGFGQTMPELLHSARQLLKSYIEHMIATGEEIPSSSSYDEIYKFEFEGHALNPVMVKIEVDI